VRERERKREREKESWADSDLALAAAAAAATARSSISDFSEEENPSCPPRLDSTGDPFDAVARTRKLDAASWGKKNHTPGGADRSRRKTIGDIDQRVYSSHECRRVRGCVFRRARRGQRCRGRFTDFSIIHHRIEWSIIFETSTTLGTSCQATTVSARSSASSRPLAITRF